MNNKKTFTPNPAQIRAAEEVLVAMAHFALVEPIVRAYQRRILEEGKWGVCPTLADRQVVPAVVREPESSFMLTESDFAVYYARCTEAAAAAGLRIAKPGGCPLLDAENGLREAQNNLTKTMADTSPVALDQVVMMAPKQFGEYVGLLLKLLTPFTRDAKEILGDMLRVPSGPEAAS